MTETVDIKKVISTSTSNVSLEDLSRKGFKRVKVLNQVVITKLIAEAVDTVLEARSKQISRDERDKVIQEAKGHFEILAKERLEQERHRIESEVIGLQAELSAKTAEIERLTRKVATLQEELDAKGAKSDTALDKILTVLNERLQTGGQPSDVNKIMLSLDTLSRRLSNIGSGGGGGGGFGSGEDPELIKDFVLGALFDKEKGAAVESNVSKVKVEQAKAGDVKGALARLKKLQKGGEDVE